MRNALSNKDISEYIRKNTPNNLPVVRKYMTAYLESLFGSDSIQEALDTLDACNDGGIKVDGEKLIKYVGVDLDEDKWYEYTEKDVRCWVIDSGIMGELNWDRTQSSEVLDAIYVFRLNMFTHQVMRMLRDPSVTPEKLASWSDLFSEEILQKVLDAVKERCATEGYTSVLNWVYNDSVHFILRDFCSSVGVAYKESYKEPILRSFVGKDIAFLEWLFFSYMGFVGKRIEVQINGQDLDYSTTDTGEVTDLMPIAYTDRFTRASAVVTVILDDWGYGESPLVKLKAFKELLMLVLPARTFLYFSYR